MIYVIHHSRRKKVTFLFSCSFLHFSLQTLNVFCQLFLNYYWLTKLANAWDFDTVMLNDLTC